MNARMGARPWLAHTQHDYALMLLARHGPGDRQRAQQLLTAAVSTYRTLGMGSWARAATAYLQTPGAGSNCGHRDAPRPRPL